MNYREFSEFGDREGYSKQLFKAFMEHCLLKGYTQGLVNHSFHWKNFNQKQAEEIIKNLKPETATEERTKEELIDIMNRKFHPIDYALQDIENIRKSSTKLENKPLKLKEDVSITEKQEIDKLKWPNNFISYGEKRGYSYYLFQKLVKHYPDYIFRAGRDWPNFDFQKGYDVIIKQKDALNLFRAGKFWNWGKFPRQEALDFLKLWEPPYAGNFNYYRRALNEWPKNIKETEKAIEDIKKASKKMPNKPLKL